MKNKVLKIVLITASITVAFILVVVIGAYSFLNFYLFPKIAGVKLSDLGIGITDVMTTITDKQVIDNILNFDKQSAAEIMKAMTELDQESKQAEAENQGGADTQSASDGNPDGETANPAENGGDSGSSSVTGENQSNDPDISKPIDAKGAYQRIMNTASKEEISEGMAIIAKVDIAKVNELRKTGDKSQVKAYVKSILTPEEISTAVTLYNKYKHLL